MTAAGKEQVLEREQRWGRTAGQITFAAVALIVASVVIKQTAGRVPTDTDAARLLFYHDHSTTLIIGEIVGSLGFAAFAIPLFFLFKAAEGRTQRVRRAFVAFAFIGPIALALQVSVSTVGFVQAGDKFVQEAPSAQDRREAAQAAADSGGGDKTTTTQTTETTGAGGAGANGKGGKGKAGDTLTTGTTTTSGASGGSDNENADPREQQADRLIGDSGTLQLGTALIFPGLLGFVIAMIYIPLWCMRTGLLTRFWATLGMALGVALIVLGPFAQLLILAWFLHVGFLLTGWARRERPPAWAAGVAIPWPRPGSPPAASPPAGDGPAPPAGDGRAPPAGDGPPAPPGNGTVEGSGREVSPPASTGEPEQPSEHPGGTLAGTQGERRKKRKRRR